MSEVKKLYRSENKSVAGVCAGIAEYINVDPTIIRLLFVLATVFTGFIPGFIAYLALAIIMPTIEEGKSNGKKR